MQLKVKVLRDTAIINGSKMNDFETTFNSVLVICLRFTMIKDDKHRYCILQNIPIVLMYNKARKNSIVYGHLIDPIIWRRQNPKYEHIFEQIAPHILTKSVQGKWKRKIFLPNYLP